MITNNTKPIFELSLHFGNFLFFRCSFDFWSIFPFGALGDLRPEIRDFSAILVLKSSATPPPDLCRPKISRRIDLWWFQSDRSTLERVTGEKCEKKSSKNPNPSNFVLEHTRSTPYPTVDYQESWSEVEQNKTKMGCETASSKPNKVR